MRIITLLLAIVPLALIEAFSYDGLVLTSIDVRKRPIDGRPNRVEFYGDRNEGTKDDDTALFLTDVKSAGEGEQGRLILEADVVDPETVKKSMQESDLKPLLCIHGFNVNPKAHLEDVKKARGFDERFNLTKKFNLIPVIWPARGDDELLDYEDKRRTESVGAGKAFKTLKEYSDMFPNKSLHAHSMGNRVLRYAADAGFKFDNIFMVAADTDSRMFDKDYIETKQEDDRNNDGLKIGQMINSERNGKIHVLYNTLDGALILSRVLNGADRLGRSGAKEEDGKLHPELVGKVSSYNYRRNHLRLWQAAVHNYQFDDPAMEFFK